MKQKYLALNGKYWRTFEGGKVQCERSISRKQTTTEWATGLGRIRQQETEKWNQMTVPRFQTEGKQNKNTGDDSPEIPDGEKHRRGDKKHWIKWVLRFETVGKHRTKREEIQKLESNDNSEIPDIPSLNSGNERAYHFSEVLWLPKHPQISQNALSGQPPCTVEKKEHQ